MLEEGVIGGTGGSSAGAVEEGWQALDTTVSLSSAVYLVVLSFREVLNEENIFLKPEDRFFLSSKRPRSNDSVCADRDDAFLVCPWVKTDISSSRDGNLSDTLVSFAPWMPLADFESPGSFSVFLALLPLVVCSGGVISVVTRRLHSLE